MKILYLCADRGIPIRGHKGAAVHVRSLTGAFITAGHAVTILTPNPGPPGGPVPKAEIRSVPKIKRKGATGNEPLAGDSHPRTLSNLFFNTAKKLIADGGFDLIYERYSLWSDAGARLAQETGRPLFLEVNAPLIAEAARYRQLPDPDLAASIERAQFKAAAAIAVVSRSLKAYVEQRGGAAACVHVLPNAVDPELFHPAVRGGQVRDRLGLHGRIVIGFAGRARPWHDLQTLFQAVAELRQGEPRFHLLLVGQMPDTLMAQLRDHGLETAATATGPVPHQEVPEYLAAMDVAVSSHLPLEDFYFSPLKLFEYLACGVPTVAAKVGQPAELIRDAQTGYLYRSGDAGSLAEQIRKLVAEPPQARRIAWEGAVSVLENHTWERNAKVILNWFKPGEQGPDPNPQGAQPALPLLDPKLRQRLYRATRADLAGPLLKRRLRRFQKQTKIRLSDISSIAVLKYKPGRRCVLHYEFEGRSRRDKKTIRYPFIGKVFRDQRGFRLHKLQKMIFDHGFGPNAGDGIQVPRSLAYIPEMRMQVQELASGETLDQLATQTSIAPMMPMVARGLAKLHTLPLPAAANGNGAPDLRTYLLSDELDHLKRFKEKLAEVRPESMPAVLALYEALTGWAQELTEPVTVTPIHRDFYYSQVLYDAERLTLIDFDLFSLGDPAIDVANFTAHLYFLGLDRLSDINALLPERTLFKSAYAKRRQLSPDFWRRWEFYETATLFRLLNVIAPRPGIVHLFDPMLRLTASRLEPA